MARFNVLDPNHSLLNPHFLEASAGTGKTFAIEHIVTRLVLDERLEALGSDILVVTFTRASTRELKVRIRENLLDVLSQIKNNQVKLEYLQLYQNEERRKKAIKKIEKVLSEYDLMEIYTIHGFCHQMLKEYPFEAKVDLQSGKDSLYTENEIYEIAVLDFLRAGLEPKYFHKNQIKKILKKQRYDASKLSSLIISYLKKNSHIETPEFFEDLKMKAQELFKLFSKSYSGASFISDFYDMSLLFKGLCNVKKEIHPTFIDQVNFFAAFLDEKICSDEFFSQLFTYDDYFYEAFTEENLKKNAKVSFEDLKNKNQLINFSESLNSLFFLAREVNYQILSMAYLCQEKIEKELQEKGIVPADFFLKIVKERLGETDFYNKVRGRYKAALIDEFQDTDPTQWEIFKKLFVEQRVDFPLFLVGDPKQSIYGFRNADLPTYLEALGCFSKQQKYTLDTNYRSEPQLIEALNSLFTFSDRWLCDKKELSYEVVKPSPFGKNTYFLDDKGPLHFLFSEVCGKGMKDGGLKEAEEISFFPFIAKEIKSFIHLGYSYENFAILIRDKFQGERLERYLKKEKIPFQASVKIPLKETQAFAFFEALAEALCHIDQAGVVKQLLISPVIGLSHRHFDKEGEFSIFLKALSLLKKGAEIFEEKGFLEFWRYFLDISFLDDGVTLQKDLLERKEKEAYFDLMQIADLIVGRHQRKLISQQELKNLLIRIKQEDPQEDGALCRRADTESVGVHIMTIHKSKGLEFQIVFALGLCVKGNLSLEVIKTKKNAKFSLEMLDENDPAHQETLRGENLEKMRQLYVALTRAKKRVYIPYFFSESASKTLSPIELFCRTSFSHHGNFTKESFIDSLAGAKELGITFSFEKHDQEGRFFSHQNESVILTPPNPFQKNYSDRFVSSFSSMQKQSHHSSLEPKSAPVIPSSGLIGEIFHSLFEKIFERGLYQLKSNQPIIALVKQECAFTPLEGLENNVLELIEDVLKKPLNFKDGSLTLSQLPFGQLTTEMEFLLQNEGEFFKGVIDLFFAYEGRYFLLDWKSNHLDSYATAFLIECMNKHSYYDQAHLYINAAKKYLEKKGVDKNLFGGMFYVFIRGVKNEGEGIIYIK